MFVAICCSVSSNDVHFLFRGSASFFFFFSPPDISFFFQQRSQLKIYEAINNSFPEGAELRWRIVTAKPPVSLPARPQLTAYRVQRRNCLDKVAVIYAKYFFINLLHITLFIKYIKTNFESSDIDESLIFKFPLLKINV